MLQRIGDRVGVILAMDDTTVKYMGGGTYLGDAPCPILGDVLNPKIQLDTGSITWGCRVWWGAEDEILRKIGDRTVIMVDVEGNRL